MAVNLESPKDVETPQACNPQVPAVLSNLVMDCCRNNPGSRPLNMDVVGERLQTAQKMLQRKATEPVKMNEQTSSQD